MPTGQGAPIHKTFRMPWPRAAQAKGALIIKTPRTLRPSAAQQEQRGGKLVLVYLAPGSHTLLLRALPNSG
eukprot:6293493-Pyramimonas_sp.AAC.1